MNHEFDWITVIHINMHFQTGQRVCRMIYAWHTCYFSPPVILSTPYNLISFSQTFPNNFFLEIIIFLRKIALSAFQRTTAVSDHFQESLGQHIQASISHKAQASPCDLRILSEYTSGCKNGANDGEKICIKQDWIEVFYISIKSPDLTLCDSADIIWNQSHGVVSCI